MTWSIAIDILLFHNKILVSSAIIDINADELFPTANNCLSIDSVVYTQTTIPK